MRTTISSKCHRSLGRGRQAPRKHRAEFEHPTPDRLIGEVKPALGKQVLHIAIAQGEPEIQPDRVVIGAANRWRRYDKKVHAGTLSHQSRGSDPVPVTMPVQL